MRNKKVRKNQLRKEIIRLILGLLFLGVLIIAPSFFNKSEVSVTISDSLDMLTEDTFREAEIMRLRDRLREDVVFVNSTYGLRAELTAEDLRSIVSFDDVSLDKEPSIRVDTEILTKVMRGTQGEPISAKFVVDGYDVFVASDIPQVIFEEEAVLDALLRSNSLFRKQVEVPVARYIAPAVASESLEGMQVEHLIASFTTYHGCCATRVENIQAIADLVDGVVLQPAEEFSLNEYVGKRTKENGFSPAGTLLQGVLVDTTGGGVSQFATTFYNAVFWAGLEDVEHHPHSRYFNRYPEGIEATISWPSPNFIFKNNRETPVLIKTKHTDTSITVEIYGDNDGRILVGDHRAGVTDVDVMAVGGEDAWIVEHTIKGPYDIIDMPIEYRMDSSLGFGQTERVSYGTRGWKVLVNRKITQKDTLIKDDNWKVRYRTQPAIFKRWSCAGLPAEVRCETKDERKEFEEHLVELYGNEEG